MRVSTRNRTFKDWHREISRLPKNLTLFRASRQLRISYPYASIKLNQHGYKVRETRGGFKGVRKLTPAILKRIDWTQLNADLGRKYKVSRERMRQVRLAHGKPKVNGRKA